MLTRIEDELLLTLARRRRLPTLVELLLVQERLLKLLKDFFLEGANPGQFQHPADGLPKAVRASPIGNDPMRRHN